VLEATKVHGALGLLGSAGGIGTVLEAAKVRGALGLLGSGGGIGTVFEAAKVRGALGLLGSGGGIGTVRKTLALVRFRELVILEFSRFAPKLSVTAAVIRTPIVEKVFTIYLLYSSAVLSCRMFLGAN
jgi:hypothetical protein